MIVPDTSAWVEYLRDTGHPIHLALRELIDDDAPLAFTEYVAMEVLSGARSAPELATLESLVMTYPLLALEGFPDYEYAAALHRACRTSGDSVRQVSDCLIAVPVIRAGAELLHNDRDFDAIARHSTLRIYPWASN